MLPNATFESNVVFSLAMLRTRFRRQPRQNHRGLSAVEVAIGVSLLGTLAAIAVPTIARQAHASHLVEATSGLERIATTAIAQAQGRPATDAFPGAAPLTPADPPRGIREVDVPGTWEHPTWKRLKFEAVPLGVSHAFSFAFESNSLPGKSTFLALAQGDLDGDGQRSTFEMRGSADDTSGPQLQTDLFVQSEFE